MNSQHQLEQVQASIAAIQLEISAAKAKVEKAEERLEKAIEEGRPADIRADLKSLLESATTELAGLRKEKDRLMEEKIKLTPQTIAKNGADFAGRSFENTFRLSFIKNLYNGGKGLTVSAEYFVPDKACRKYSNQTEPELMDQCRTKLKAIGWTDIDTRFEDIEMDCVLRCYIDSGKSYEFAEPAKILLPKKLQHRESSLPPFTKSDSELVEANSPNSYIVVEITSNSANLMQKMMQLEKDLLFLLLRHQKQQSQPTVALESVISYVVLVIPYSPLKKSQMDESIHTEILAKKDICPLLYRIYEIGRFVRYFTPSGMKAIITELSAHVAENSSLSHESSQLSLEIKQLDKITKELTLARTLSETDPALIEEVSRLEKEAKRMIFSSKQENDE